MSLRIFEGDPGVRFLSRRDSRKVVDLDGDASASAPGISKIEESHEQGLPSDTDERRVAPFGNANEPTS